MPDKRLVDFQGELLLAVKKYNLIYQEIMMSAVSLFNKRQTKVMVPKLMKATVKDIKNTTEVTREVTVEEECTT